MWLRMWRSPYSSSNGDYNPLIHTGRKTPVRRGSSTQSHVYHPKISTPSCPQYQRRSSDVHRVQLQIQLHRSACFFTGGTHLSLKDLLYTQHWNDCEENVVLQHFSPTCAISPAAINKVAFERSFEAVSRRRGRSGRSGGWGFDELRARSFIMAEEVYWNKKPWNGGFG